MKAIHLGVPVLRRYDLLRKLLLSAEASTVRPELVMIIDNGNHLDRVAEAMDSMSLLIEVHTPEIPLGVAESWNYLIKRLPEERIITNDDITFEPDSLEKMAETPGDLVFGYGYSCYLIRDSAVQKIGLFDEAISPGYAYWEDIDYDMRIRLAVREGTEFVQVNAPCVVNHLGSQTNEWATAQEIQDHHRKFEIAKTNLWQKYKHLPFEEQHPALQPHLRRGV